VRFGSLAMTLAGLSACAVAAAASPGKTWKLPFWIDGEVEGVADADVQSHPCGAIVELAVSAIPLARPNIDTDRVVEFDAAGAIIREWRIPVDYPPVAVEGDRLIVSDHAEPRPVFLAIRPSGEIDDFAVPLAQQGGAQVQCPPTVISHSGGSDYLQCERWIDRSSGSRRLVAYEAPCT
jgi:hypothetical protein